jgi:hypothetical protein
VRKARKSAVTETPPRSFLAPIVSLEDSDLMRARLRDPAVDLSMTERIHIADTWHPKRRRRRPPLPAILKPIVSVDVAKTFIWELIAEGKNRKRAMQAVKEKHGCGTRTTEKHLAEARQFRSGTWYPEAERQARKRKRSFFGQRP